MTKRPRLKSATLNMWVEPNLKALAAQAAADDGRSLTSLIEKLLTDHLRQRGYLPPLHVGASSTRPASTSR